MHDLSNYDRIQDSYHSHLLKKISELFEVGPRPAAMALGSLCNWGGNFLVGMTFPSLQSAIGPYSFLLFALSTGLLCAFVT